MSQHRGALAFRRGREVHGYTHGDTRDPPGGAFPDAYSVFWSWRKLRLLVWARSLPT